MAIFTTVDNYATLYLAAGLGWFIILTLLGAGAADADYLDSIFPKIAAENPVLIQMTSLAAQIVVMPLAAFRRTAPVGEPLSVLCGAVGGAGLSMSALDALTL